MNFTHLTCHSTAYIVLNKYYVYSPGVSLSIGGVDPPKLADIGSDESDHSVAWRCKNCGPIQIDKIGADCVMCQKIVPIIDAKMVVSDTGNVLGFVCNDCVEDCENMMDQFLRGSKIVQVDTKCLTFLRE